MRMGRSQLATQEWFGKIRSQLHHKGFVRVVLRPNGVKPLEFVKRFDASCTRSRIDGLTVDLAVIRKG